ncbi:MAG: hypothetical protein JW811_09080 [Clostridiales bacterium]|nr:hypothetical protein [Clostridiales bacterium]
MRAAIIGIGSNSLRLLVADIIGGAQTAVLRERIGLRVFASLNERHEIDETMIHNACEAVALMKETAIRQSADIIRLFATSAVRDAANKTALADALMRKTGITLDILTGETEAKLSFLGATGNGSAGVIDIGGGSTEIVIGDHGQIAFACSLQAGAVRLFRELQIKSASGVRRVMDAVEELLASHMVKIKQQKAPSEWLGVGGTLTAAATYVQDIPWNSHGRIHGFILERPDIRRVTETLAGMTLKRRLSLETIPPDRADIIVHGFAILLSCMETLKINEIKVSEHTNLDGYLITAGE